MGSFLFWNTQEGGTLHFTSNCHPYWNSLRWGSWTLYQIFAIVNNPNKKFRCNSTFNILVGYLWQKHWITLWKRFHLQHSKCCVQEVTSGTIFCNVEISVPTSGHGLHNTQPYFLVYIFGHIQEASSKRLIRGKKKTNRSYVEEIWVFFT